MLNSRILNQFQCVGCGECCRWTGSVLLTNQDISILGSHLGLTEQAFIDRHTRLAPNRIQLALMDHANGSCSFLEGNRCSVYNSRPEQCRSFPFAWSVSEGCPALDKLLDSAASSTTK